MKLFIVLSLVAFAVARQSGYHYDLKYESFDIEEMTNNDSILKAYILCFKGLGKCTPEGSDFKRWIPEAVETSCIKCSDKQKVLVAKCLKAIATKLPEDFVELCGIFDPEKKRDVEIQNFIATYSV